MGRYDQYILSQLLVMFGFFSLILISIYWINRAVEMFDLLIADGQSLAVFLEFTALGLPAIMITVLPASAFVTTLYIFNRMISESELVILQTAGMGAIRLLRPVAVFGLLLAILIAILAHIIAPAAHTEFNVRSTEVARNIDGKLLREGQFIYPADGVVVYIHEITESGELRDIFLHDRSSISRETIYSARRALLMRGTDGPKLVMLDGIAQTLIYADARLSIVEFDDFTYDINTLIEVSDAWKYDLRELSTPVILTANQDFIAAQGYSRAQMMFEVHERIARTFFVLLVPIIGAATLILGTFSRFGIWPQILLAVVLIIPLQMTWNTIKIFAVQDVRLVTLIYVQPILAMAMAAGLVYLGMRTRQPRQMPA
ncbi:MAG: LptF/LptG family permease [Rhodobacteraceae bacterium]|nr:LptF/LptG family permease [Paracoccaceae bacterium]